jgi:hypothetical protein
MSHNFVDSARHPRLRRIILTGVLLVAASVAVVVVGQVGFITPAAAASLAVSTASAPAASASRVRAELAAQRAIVDEKHAAQAAADQAAANAAAAAATQAAAAQAAAAHAAAAQAAAARAAAATAARVPASSLTVWTAGWQAEINACRGGVDITAHYGTPTIAEHWSCGGRSFPTAAGAIVTITGLDAGTYRVTGVVAILDASTANTSQIPGGYSLLFQTCRNGDSHFTQFVGLQRVG